MTVHLIRPDDEDSFTPTSRWTVPEVYHRGQDGWPNLDVIGGHGPLSGVMIRLEQRELSAGQALKLAQALTDAADWFMSATGGDAA